MGASGWMYYITYQPDMEKALADLLQEVFKSGSYNRPFTAEDYLEILGEKASPVLARSLPSRSSLAVPLTIEELRAQRGEGGTGSILDIDHIASAPEPGAISHLPGQKMIEIFGTERPSRNDVDHWVQRVRSVQEETLYRRGQGIYIVIYKDGCPYEVYIEGASGD